MKKTKEQIIADLYALRSGLSIISQKKDLIVKEERQITVLNSQMDAEKDLFGKAVANSDDTEKAYQAELNLLAKTEAELGSLITEKEIYVWKAQYKIDAYRKEKIEGFNRAIAIKDGKKIGRNKYNFSEINRFFWGPYDDMGRVGRIFLWLLTYYTVPAVTYLVHLTITRPILISKYAKQYAEERLNKEKERLAKKEVELKEESASFDQRISQKQAEIVRIKEKVKSLKEELETKKQGLIPREEQKKAYILERENEIIVRNDSIKSIANEAKDVKNALVLAYGEMIAESDWENTDLLIYYFETGRADSVKEALLLVDKQRQTDQIVGAISAASIAVQSSIQTAPIRMARALQESFNIIGDQLSQISRGVSGLERETKRTRYENERLAEEQGRALNNLGARFSEMQQKQLSATDLSNALLEKANRSSEELLNDLRYGQKYWIK